MIRRLTGGRVAAAGEGFLGVSLVLPHRSALISDDPYGLRPEQMPNRHVRGILAALRIAGVPAPFYRGRDEIHAAGRIVGTLALEEARNGALLFQAQLSLRRDTGLLMQWLDSADPDGAIKIDIGAAVRDASSLAEVASIAADFDSIAECLCAGYRQELGVSLRGLGASEVPPCGASERWGEPWLRQRVVGKGCLRALRPSQLGMMEVELRVDEGGRITRATIAGDLIANSAGVAELEERLRGRLYRSTEQVGSVIAGVLRDPRHFFLGTTAELLVDLISSAS
ncbi:MAG TPA: hypothetical protein VEB21_00130 [Terriglobales bacterium]|nr:hypothetical protein [Terriglobales bacterium]